MSVQPTQSIIESILSPKIVGDGSGGYVVKTDIVNVDNLTTTGTLTIGRAAILPYTSSTLPIIIATGSSTKLPGGISYSSDGLVWKYVYSNLPYGGVANAFWNGNMWVAVGNDSQPPPFRIAISGLSVSGNITVTLSTSKSTNPTNGLINGQQITLQDVTRGTNFNGNYNILSILNDNQFTIANTYSAGSVSGSGSYGTAVSSFCQVNSISGNGSVVSVTTAFSLNYEVGTIVNIYGSGVYDGIWVVANVTTPNSFTINSTRTGTATIPTSGLNIVNNGIAYSLDGKTWSHSSGSISQVNCVYSNGNQWVAMGYDSTNLGNTALFSTDGLNWTLTNTVSNGTTAFTTSGNGILWTGTIWVGVGSGTNGVTIAYSYDGLRWIPISGVKFLISGNALASDGTIIAAVGISSSTLNTDAILISYTEGTVWANISGVVNSTTAISLYDIAYNGYTWVAVGTNGTGDIIVTSNDAQTWTQLTGGIFNTMGTNGYTFQGVAWTGDIWLAIDNSPIIYYSMDAKTWAPYTGGIDNLDGPGQNIRTNNIWKTKPTTIQQSIDMLSNTISKHLNLLL